ncbi:unnamed protein product [Blepharisma stoltei]|uniref:Receptor ligand binding region domain-containing protein n=1 Tax=Blepharisma stoltei TaxID=1481888 RepID=A0AAU9K0A4_9CILI|nr:unnamed protein product [Blepharisma stoltei]
MALTNKKQSNETLTFSRFLFFFSIFLLSKSTEVLIIYSNYTKISISDFIFEIQQSTSALSAIEITACDFLVAEEEISNRPNLVAVFDISNDLSFQFRIAKLCENNLIVHFLYTDSLPYENKWTFSLSSSKLSLNRALIITLAYFNWTDGIAVTDIQKFSNLQDLFRSYFKDIEVFSVSSDTFIKDFIGIEMKKLGSSLFYLFINKDISLQIQQYLVDSKQLGDGTGILLIKESSYGSNIDGTLGLVEKGKEFVESEDSYLSLTILEMITSLNNASDTYILNFLEEKCPNHYCINEFSVINIQEKQRKIVGSIVEGNFKLLSSIVFPGNSKKIPISQKKVLYFSASDGTTDPGGVPYASVAVFARGLTLAVKDINSGQNILENFQLKLNHFDCGASVYNAAFALNCFEKDKDKVGLAHITAPMTATAFGAMISLKKLNITVPYIGAVNSGPELSNTTAYPYYSRISLPSSWAYTQIPIILKVMGWESIAILYQNDISGSAAFYYLNQTCAKQNIKIVNEHRGIPPLLDREGLKNYTNVIKEVVDSNVRFVTLVFNPPEVNYIAEIFYDLGMRRGDVLFYSTYPGWLTTVATQDEFLYKRVEIAIPMVIIFQSLFVGEIGKKVHDDLYKAYGNTEPATYACLYYDAGMLIGNAIDWTINHGTDYTDPDVLNAAVRDVRFTGCTGSMSIQKGSNDRQFSSFTIQSNSYNFTSGALKTFIVGYFTPTGSTILKIETPFVYADGTTNKPSDFRITRTNCPFDDKLKRTFGKGRALVFGICFFIAALTVIVTFFIWKKWWNRKVDPLTKAEEISLEDFIVGVTIGVEFFQFISQGPDIRPLNAFLADIGDAVSLDLESFAKLENGVFWWIATIIIILCGVWTIFCLEIFFQLDEKLNHIWFFRALSFLADNSMPILGNLCFIPFISILLEIFLCDHSIGNHFTDSYLNKDCYQFCWKGDHIIYVVLSAFSLFFYEPLAVFCRPLWQELQSNLHVKSMPLYLMVKTVIQVMLVVMNKTLKRSSDIAHGFVFTVLILMYAGFVWRFKAFNYARFNWWQQLSLIGVAWVSFLSTINFLAGGTTFPWISLILGGWVIVVLIGLAVQKKKYPSLLFRKKGKDTSTLFKFAFTFGRQSKMHQSKIEPHKLDLFGSK